MLLQTLSFADWPLDALARLALNALAVVVLVRLIYYRIYRRTDLFLTFFVFNLIIFLVTYLLNQVQLSIGAAFGLFAVFSMLRYRTDGLSAKDMTYLFVVIALGLMSAVFRGGLGALAGLNVLVITVVWLLEGGWLIRREWTQTVLYDRIDLIAPHRRAELLADLRLRTGLPVHRVELHQLDFLRDAAQLTFYYYQPQNATSHEITTLAEP